LDELSKIGGDGCRKKLGARKKLGDHGEVTRNGEDAQYLQSQMLTEKGFNFGTKNNENRRQGSQDRREGRLV